MENVPGEAEKWSQEVWIRCSDTTKLSPTWGSDPRQVWGEKADEGLEMQAKGVRFPGQDLDQQDTSPGTDMVVL